MRLSAWTGNVFILALESTFIHSEGVWYLLVLGDATSKAPLPNWPVVCVMNMRICVQHYASDPIQPGFNQNIKYIYKWP